MEHASRNPAPVLASHLYDFVTCEHRIALDARLDRSERTPPDPDTALLFEHGMRFERRIAEELGYPEVTVQPGEWVRAASETLDLMRAGVPGIYQGVLLQGRYLAQPDFLERVEGRSAVGEFHYRPGDAKSALHARSDAALQVAFAALLLERMQNLRPESGFVILGDGTREEFDLASVWTTLEDVVERVSAVADGEEESFPFFSRECTRCRWRGTCLPGMQQAQDLSFTHGLTRTRARVLGRYGIRTVADLAAADTEKLKRAGAPTDGLERLRMQAHVLLGGRVFPRGAVDLPDADESSFYMHLEADPLDRGAPFLFSMGRGPEEVRAVLARDDIDRQAAFRELVKELEAGGANVPIFHYGSGTPRALDFMGDLLSMEPGRLGDLEGRMVDLAPQVRRAAVLPVHFYEFEEVAAVALNEPRPDPASPSPAPFLRFNALLYAEEEDDGIREGLIAQGRDRIRKLVGIRRWLDRLMREEPA